MKTVAVTKSLSTSVAEPAMQPAAAEAAEPQDAVRTAQVEAQVTVTIHGEKQ